MNKSNSSNNQNMHFIPQTIPYRQCQEPLLSQQKTLQIQQKLMLQKQAISYAKERQANLDYYLKYNYNPFIQYRGQEAAYIQSILKSKKDVVSIVHKLAEMKKQGQLSKNNEIVLKQNIKVQPRIQTQSQHLKSTIQNFQLFSDKILNNVQALKTQNVADIEIKRRHSPSKIKRRDTMKQPEEQEQTSTRNPTQAQISKFDIQKIALIKQQNFFLKKNKKVNIFKIARDQDEDVSSKDLLKKYYFCLDSISQRISKIKIPVYREISTLARKVIKGQITQNQRIIQYVDSSQHSFKIKQLLFHDLMTVASNRFSPDYLNKVLNFDQGPNKQMSDTSSQQKSDYSIVYKKAHLNQQNNFINPNQQLQQIQDYKLLKSNEVEIQYEKNYIRQKQRIQQKLQLRKNITCLTVNDKMLHHDIKNSVHRIVQKFVKMDDSKLPIDRIVRLNKTTKNRSEAIKIKTLMQTLANKNKHDQLLSGRSVSKSKSKSQKKK